MHLQFGQVKDGPKYYYNFEGEPGQNNWYKDDGVQLSKGDLRAMKRALTERGYNSAIQRGWSYLGGDGSIRAIPAPDELVDPTEGDVGAP